jgi:hypothetical protein
LALLEQQGRVDEQTSFSGRQLHAFYNRSDQILTQLEGRGLLTCEAERYALFSGLFGEWIRREITNTTRDHQSYDDWLASNRSFTSRLPTEAKKNIDEILPKISSKYRELIISWISDPRHLIAIAELFKGVLGIH